MTNLELMRRISDLVQSGTPSALATIIRTKGSTPRKVGTKMIVYPDGTVEGTVGGGCGEGEVIEAALEVIKTGQAKKHKVDLTKGLFYEDGGICGGIQDIFIEPISSSGE